MTIAFATRRVRAIVLCCLVGLCMTCPAFAQNSNDKVHVDIPAQSLSSALTQFGRDTGTEIVFTPETVSQKVSTAIKGDFAKDKALALMLAGTGLTYRVTAQGAIVINGSPSPDKLKEQTSGNGAAGVGTRVAQSAAGKQEALPAGDESTEVDEKSKKSAGLTEIVVTGTHIRGIGPTGSPLTVLTRVDIENTGLGTVEDVLRTLPQNFGGGNTDLNQGSLYVGSGSSTNFAIGAGANLRGLGNDATLVLLNGRRLAPSGVGSYTDLSLIPLAAVERIEVMSDGASAIYGSDAVGGVINIITRKDYDGAETRLRYGSVTSGSRREVEAGQVLGRNWSSGSALLSYDYLDDTSLLASDRSFASGLATLNGFTVPDVDILPQQTRHNVLLSLSQAIVPGITLSSNAYYGGRDTRAAVPFFPGTAGVLTYQKVSTDEYGGTVDLAANLYSDWKADLSGTFSRNDTTSKNFDAGAISGRYFEGNASVSAAEANSDGTLFILPAGAVKAAVGAQWRRESYDSSGTANMIPFPTSRTVEAAYGEIAIPVLGGNANDGRNTLTFSAAGRYEHYSDFGSSTNPKLSLLWSPVDDLKVRGSWGTSYRAPLLSELNNIQTTIFAYKFPDITGTTPAIYLQNGNPSLGPEKATTWTAGADITPSVVPNLRLSITYYSVDFKGRIDNPIPTTAYFTALQNQAIYGSFITRDPALAEVEELFATPGFRNYSGVSANAIGAIIDNNLTNVAVWNEDGIDVDFLDKIDTSLGQLSAGVSATYITSLRETLITGTAPVGLRNTLYNPIAFRMRDSFGWAFRKFTTTAFLNVSGVYTNNVTKPEERVGSWTTIDWSARYQTGTAAPAAMRNVTISLSIQNLLNRDPPYVSANNLNTINYDPANASPLGRFVSLEVKKAW